VSRLIHNQGVRRSRRFIAVNCSGIPETLLESELFGHVKGSFTGAYRDKPGLAKVADGGTLFLDELGEMSLRMQAVLLRFAETGEIQPVGADGVTISTDVRIITATNRDLRDRITLGEFREDLYYRLNVITLRVPPLRDRAEDVRILLRHFLAQAAASHQRPVPELTAAAELRLMAHRWPGNVRELKNVTERLVVRQSDGPITVDDLPIEVCGDDASKNGAPDPRAASVTVAPPSGRRDEGRTTRVAEQLWDRLMAGENFWTAVHQPFKSHDLTREDVRCLIARGLQHTRGSYRQLVAEFRLPPSDYKRFLAFLSQHDCNLSFQRHRVSEAQAQAAEPERCDLASSTQSGSHR
jgi:DNA-binding NtrC family response regulator